MDPYVTIVMTFIFIVCVGIPALWDVVGKDIYWAITHKEQRLERKLAERKNKAEEALHNLELEHGKALEAEREYHRLQHREWTQEYYDALPESKVTMIEVVQRGKAFENWIIHQIKLNRATLREDLDDKANSYITYKEYHYE